MIWETVAEINKREENKIILEKKKGIRWKRWSWMEIDTVVFLSLQLMELERDHRRNNWSLMHTTQRKCDAMKFNRSFKLFIKFIFSRACIHRNSANALSVLCYSNSHFFYFFYHSFTGFCVINIYFFCSSWIYDWIGIDIYSLFSFYFSVIFVLFYPVLRM